VNYAISLGTLFVTKFFKLLLANYRNLFLFLFLGILGGWYCFFWVPPYYFFIPLRVDDYWEVPVVQMEISGKKYDVELDLGIRLSTLPKEDLEGIDKDFYGTFYTFDVHGKTYASPIYQIAGIKVHDFRVPMMRIREESLELVANNTVGGDSERPPYTRRLGGEMFEDRNFLLDCAQSKIILCKSFKNLTRENYRLEEFIKIPFRFDNMMGICLEVEIDTGVKTLILNTGASRSILRGSSLEGKNAEESLQNMSAWSSKKFVLGGHDFGERKLYLFKISSVLAEVDGILGMDFLKEHAVYLDMGRHVAYIEKRTKPTKAIPENGEVF
jgi:hypothetical protein